MPYPGVRAAAVLVAGLLAALPGRRRPGQTAGPATSVLRTAEAREAFLEKADVVGARQLGKGVTKPWRLTLKEGDVVQDAAFQDVDAHKEEARFRSGRTERDFRDFYGYNIAAYRLARLLGYDDLVPVSIERVWKGRRGALTWWVDKKWDEDERVKEGAEPPDVPAWERQLYLARAFTALVADTDRNLGNQLVTADFHLWLIDFTRAFRHTHGAEDAVAAAPHRSAFLRSAQGAARRGRRGRVVPVGGSAGAQGAAGAARRDGRALRGARRSARRPERGLLRIRPHVPPFAGAAMNAVVHEAINRQINAELTASYSYLQMSAFCARQAFNGCAHWLRLQSQEEYGHAMKLYDFLIARDGAVELGAMPAPKQTFDTIAAVFEAALSQEQEVSRQIDALYELAFREKAFAATVELQWFLTEQVEEEKSAREIVAKFRLVGNDPSSLLDLDRELGSRTRRRVGPGRADG